jgi:hypothetical protein
VLLANLKEADNQPELAGCALAALINLTLSDPNKVPVTPPHMCIETLPIFT